jgi:uncharacterized protein (DUF934 family)
MNAHTVLDTSLTATGADVFRNGRFEPDGWRVLAADEDLPAEGGALLPVGRFLAAAADGSLGNRPVGVVIAPADRVRDLLPHLDRLSLIAVEFPKFSDGRGFSHAAQLVRAGFRGELRAVGNVLIDQITHMRRVGFNAYVVAHPLTRRYLSEGRDPAPKRYYQPAAIAEPPAGTRPWLRRAETIEA